MDLKSSLTEKVCLSVFLLFLPKQCSFHSFKSLVPRKIQGLGMLLNYQSLDCKETKPQVQKRCNTWIENEGQHLPPSHELPIKIKRNPGIARRILVAQGWEGEAWDEPPCLLLAISGLLCKCSTGILLWSNSDCMKIQAIHSHTGLSGTCAVSLAFMK